MSTTAKKDRTSLGYLLDTFDAKGISLHIEDTTHLSPAPPPPEAITRKMEAQDLAMNLQLSQSTAGPVSQDDQPTRKIRFSKRIEVSPLPEPELIIESVPQKVSSTGPRAPRIPSMIDDTEKESIHWSMVFLPRSPTAKLLISPGGKRLDQSGYHPLCQLLLALITAFLLFLVQGC